VHGLTPSRATKRRLTGTHTFSTFVCSARCDPHRAARI
jgi:hypothetical protein